MVSMYRGAVAAVASARVSGAGCWTLRAAAGAGECSHSGTRCSGVC